MGTLIQDARLAASLPGPATRMAIRRRAHVSRADIAAELGCATATVTRWELGQREPQRELRREYARLLKRLERVAASARQDAAGDGPEAA
jgi:DNA-binding transcriptional regulator YiaG